MGIEYPGLDRPFLLHKQSLNVSEPNFDRNQDISYDSWNVNTNRKSSGLKRNVRVINDEENQRPQQSSKLSHNIESDSSKKNTKPIVQDAHIHKDDRTR